MDIKTLIVNLYGGPGTGKSTTAALIFAKLKQLGHNAELVREYVKEWAWENRHPGPFDQFYFFGKQSRKESLLYGKVDFIVTDSPVSLAAFYAQKFSCPTTANGIATVVDAFYTAGKAAGHRYMDVFLERTKAYNPKGRFQTEGEAVAMDNQMEQFLLDSGLPMWYCGTEEADINNLVVQIETFKSLMDKGLMP